MARKQTTTTKKTKSSLSPSPKFLFPKSLHEYLTTPTPNYTPTPEIIEPGQIIIIANFLPPKLCAQLIQTFTTSLHLEPTPQIKSKEYAARYNDRASLVDLNTAHALWVHLRSILLNRQEEEEEEEEDGGKELWGEFSGARGLNPHIRIYRYGKHHHFGAHYDDSVKCYIPPEGTKQGTTKWTLLVYLSGCSDGLRGGSTIFYKGDGGAGGEVRVEPVRGMALLHKHGDSCLLHEGEIVTSGEKWVLRSDVIF
ncbi:uncharacterized protein LODBEIA_P44800 [Lodderomyces beijingensis]|uniref:Fe2OG dioxygenase domain-containing protein n=1 Tax=Lodderomyces beijingensis TaxID=1775926 RepID=A0ABP0ZQ16_9ASCO